MRHPNHVYECREGCGYETTDSRGYCPYCECGLTRTGRIARRNLRASRISEADKRWPICPDYIITAWAIEDYREGHRRPVAIHPNEPFTQVAV